MSTKKDFQLHTARNGKWRVEVHLYFLNRVILHKDLIYPVDFMSSLFLKKNSQNKTSLTMHGFSWTSLST